MNGPEHYRVAETLLANLRDEMSGHPVVLLRTEAQQTQMIAEAQVHATLALAAANAAASANDFIVIGSLQRVGEAWGRAIS